MKNKYIDLVGQTFDFPQDEFRVEDGTLYVNDINMMDIIKGYGTPLKITYLPKISSQIQRAKRNKWKSGLSLQKEQILISLENCFISVR